MAIKKNSIRNSILLFITAIIWGTSFVAQSAGMEYIGPFTFSFIRYIIGGTILLPVIYLIRKKTDSLSSIKLSIKYGIGCGFILFAASSFQQMAMLHSSAGKAGFITALYIILVPVIGLFMKKKTSPVIWISVLLGLIGLYFLCIGRNGGFSLEISDFQLIVCSLLFSFHIIFIDYANSKNVDGVIVSSTQFYTAAVLSSFFIYHIDGLFYDMVPTFSLVKSAIPALCYSGIMACGVAYTLQILGQNDVNPTVASLIMSLESVVSAISGFLILRQKLSVDEIIGCFMMFLAILLAEIPVSIKNNSKNVILNDKIFENELNI